MFFRDNDVLYVSSGEDFIPVVEPKSNYGLSRNSGKVGDWVILNVGGTYFTTSLVTITKEPSSMLAR